VTVSANNHDPRDVEFTVTNTSAQPIEISTEFVLQHLVPRDDWVDLTSLPVNGCAGPDTKCVVIAQGASLSLHWLGTTCGQCVCNANARAEPGQYRLIAHSCDGKIDYNVESKRATVVLP
jgi:hypothetical protein